MNRGIPSHRFLAGAYWRNRAGMPADFSTADPAEDGCGLLWFPPVLPFTGAAVKEFLGLAEPIFARFDFDFFVTFSSGTARALGAVMTIAYDRSEETTSELQSLMRDSFAVFLLTPKTKYKILTFLLTIQSHAP